MGSFPYSPLLLAIIALFGCIYFEDSLYSAYMGQIEHNLEYLQQLTSNNPQLSSPFNQALCRKAEVHQNSLKANKLSTENIIVKSNSLRIIIHQPTGVRAEIVTSNIVKFTLEGVAITLDSINRVNVIVTCDEKSMEISRNPVHTTQGLEYTVALKNILTGAHKLDITATIPKPDLGIEKGRYKTYFASNSTVFFYLDDAIDNSAALNQLLVHSSKSILTQELSLQDMNESDVEALLTQSVYGERINAVARSRPVVEPPVKGVIHLPGYAYKKSFHIVSPVAEGIIQSDLSVDVAVPIIFVQRSHIKLHLIVDDRYFDITELMTSNTKMPHLDTHTAFLDLLQRDHEEAASSGLLHSSAHFEQSLLLRPELLQYTGLLNFDLHGIDPGSHQLQLIVTQSSGDGGVGEEVVLASDAVRVHRHR